MVNPQNRRGSQKDFSEFTRNEGVVHPAGDDRENKVDTLEKWCEAHGGDVEYDHEVDDVHCRVGGSTLTVEHDGTIRAHTRQKNGDSVFPISTYENINANVKFMKNRIHFSERALSTQSHQDPSHTFMVGRVPPAERPPEPDY